MHYDEFYCGEEVPYMDHVKGFNTVLGSTHTVVMASTIVRGPTNVLEPSSRLFADLFVCIGEI